MCGFPFNITLKNRQHIFLFVSSRNIKDSAGSTGLRSQGSESWSLHSITDSGKRSTGVSGSLFQGEPAHSPAQERGKICFHARGLI